ncbi:putative cytoplasm protein [Filobasidium floriforme]|uniref:putative cytoplasm protein n=1 Tax=Filobasidium floriforme TaxID=5210 RepID=UPI001E8D3861|nr:putative cytoplasm protein [Filobasidium floriforme]KAH8080549.1 putative cytoplasm protein [Filobasidium floriforme]
MPPKSKTDDKTFGMKNKKGGKAQKYLNTISKQTATSGKSKEEIAKEKANEAKKKEKEMALAQKKAEAELFKTALVQPKVPFGVDPKTIMCVFFKAGVCEKGNRCKFSHDKEVERKVSKANVYTDTREKKDEKATDTMDKWDEEKLRKVVSSKTGNPKTTTDIVCKYFIQAIEDQKYGWFWDCPNGVDCKYRHALPPGFVLKSEKKALDELAKKDVISLEDFVETERHKLKGPFTPVTPETFAIWLKQRADKKAAEADAAQKAKATQRAAGRINGMSGRHMFEFGGVQDEEEGEDEDWDIQRYLADRDRDGRAESVAGDEQGYREGADDGEDEDDDDNEDGRQENDGEDEQGQGENGGSSGDGEAAAGNGVAGSEGKKAGLSDQEVKGAVDKMEQVRLAT